MIVNIEWEVSEEIENILLNNLIFIKKVLFHNKFDITVNFY
jgi:hypothetical protein